MCILLPLRPHLVAKSALLKMLNSSSQQFPRRNPPTVRSNNTGEYALAFFFFLNLQLSVGACCLANKTFKTYPRNFGYE